VEGNGLAYETLLCFGYSRAGRFCERKKASNEFQKNDSSVTRYAILTTSPPLRVDFRVFVVRQEPFADPTAS
jgi:hypothetical protein